MGQYYRVILTNERGNHRVYNREVNGEYMLAKLTEHSWWCNQFVSSICAKIYKNPTKVVWVGDYSDNGDLVNIKNRQEMKKLHDIAWKGRGYGIKENLLYLDHRFLCNHTKGMFIDCQVYYERNNRNGWCIHPLPILTCIGNGLGGGDFRYTTEDTTKEMIGAWANDEISVEEDNPKNYKEIFCIFKEE